MMKMQRAKSQLKPVLILAGLALGAAAFAASSASAHHSFAMFDAKTEMTVQGTVKEWQWTNPHTWLQVMVADSAGKQVEWSIEGSSLNILARMGWSNETFKPGDKVSVVIHPMKDGTPGGQFLKAVLPNGKTIAR
jgi:hypothetical protein